MNDLPVSKQLSEPFTSTKPTRQRNPLQFSLACLVVAGLAAVVWFLASVYVFVFFQDYDDEGYILITIREFLKGHALYDQVFSQYGPFFYLFNWVLSKCGIAVASHDAARLATAVVWVASAVLAGIVVYRLTQSLLSAALVVATAFTNLFELSYEPGHPQGLCLLLVMLVLVLTALVRERWRPLTALALGALLGGLALTKVNVGLFALIGLGLSLAATTPGWTARVIGVLAGAGALALPAALMSQHLHQPWVRQFVLSVTFAVIPVVMVVWQGRPAWWRGRDWLAALVALLLVLAGTSAFVLLRGTSVDGLLEGVLLQHQRFASVYYLELAVNSWGPVAGLVSLAIFWILRKPNRRQTGGGELLLRAAQALFAALVFYNANIQGFSVLLSIALPFAWLGLMARGDATPAEQFARLSLVAVAVLESLVAFPVAGTQRAFATVLLIVIAGVCLKDVLAALGDALAEAWRDRQRVWLALELAGAAALAVYYFQPIQEARAFYAGRFSLGLPGAELLHIDSAHSAAFRWLTSNLQAAADTFVTMPGLNSLYLWTEEAPPTTWNATTWMTLFDARRQQQIVDEAEQHPRLCAVRHNRHTARWLRGQAINGLPLVRFINEQFETIGHFGGYEFRIKTGRAKPDLLWCAEPPLPEPGNGSGEWSGRMTLLPQEDRRLAGLRVVAPASQRVLAETSLDQGFSVYTDAGSQQIDLKRAPLDLAGGCRLRLHAEDTRVWPRDVPLVIELLGADGTAFAAVPILER
jgi:hypothetical protein